MKNLMNDLIGLQGEYIFAKFIIDSNDGGVSLMRPVFLGDKFPTIDFFVELVNYTDKKCFFFATIKTTRSRHSNSSKTIKVNLKKEEIQQLNKIRAPVYLFAIDGLTETGYFICANRLDSSKNLNSIPITHQLNEINIRCLCNEVAAYWNNSSEIENFSSRFN